VVDFTSADRENFSVWKKKIKNAVSKITAAKKIFRTLRRQDMVLTEQDIVDFTRLTDLMDANPLACEEVGINRESLLEIFDNFMEEVIRIYKNDPRNPIIDLALKSESLFPNFSIGTITVPLDLIIEKPKAIDIVPPSSFSVFL